MILSNSAITSTRGDLIGTLWGRTQKIVGLNGNLAPGRTTKRDHGVRGDQVRKVDTPLIVTPGETDCQGTGSPCARCKNKGLGQGCTSEGSIGHMSASRKCVDLTLDFTMRWEKSNVNKQGATLAIGRASERSREKIPR